MRSRHHLRHLQFEVTIVYNGKTNMLRAHLFGVCGRIGVGLRHRVRPKRSDNRCKFEPDPSRNKENSRFKFDDKVICAYFIHLNFPKTLILTESHCSVHVSDIEKRRNSINHNQYLILQTVMVCDLDPNFLTIRHFCSHRLNMF